MNDLKEIVKKVMKGNEKAVKDNAHDYIAGLVMEILNKDLEPKGENTRGAYDARDVLKEIRSIINDTVIRKFKGIAKPKKDDTKL